MSRIRVSLTLMRGPRKMNVSALVETRARMTVIPRSVADHLSLPLTSRLAVYCANGRMRRMPASGLAVRLKGREVPVTVLVAPTGEVRLGSIALATLEASVDPRRRRLRFGAFHGLMAA